MKILLVLFSFIFLTSFSNIVTEKKLPNGHYLVELDEEYRNLGLHNFEFTIENEKLTMEIAKQLEILEVSWIDENSFIVKGYTEPLHPNSLEKEIMKNYVISFNITKVEKNDYYFILGPKTNKDSVYSGKFVKVE